MIKKEPGMNKNVHSGDFQIVNFTVDNINYGVPVEQVREVRDMQSVTPVPGAPSYVEGVTNLRGQIITVFDLRKRLGLPEKKGAGEKILVIDLDKSAVGVVVDAVTEVSTIKEADVEKNMEVTSALGDFILGVGKQNDHLAVILDISKIVVNTGTQEIPN
jgi:purine-binding chemotaxis protein CheW